MEKNVIENFISKYSLGGEIESVKIESNDSKMNVSFISDDKTLLGNVSIEDGNFPNGNFGIYTTSKLKSLLSVLESNVDVQSTESYIKFSDNNTSVNYMLADLSVIPVVPDLKQLPSFNVEVTLDDEFISKFIKSKTALSESDTFTFQCKGGVGKVILGYSTLNTNRISINVNCKCDGDIEPISFSARYLKEILNSNRGSNSATLKISSQGLTHVSFLTNTTRSNYYLVEIK